MTNDRKLIVRHFPGLVDYQRCWQAMRTFTRERDPATCDEVWLLQHAPVYTLGVRERADDIIDCDDIPVVKSDRGGLVTYHGPGQLVVYVLLDLRRLGLGLKSLVAELEQVIINVLSSFAVVAERREQAPGVYVDGRKLASLGLRVLHGRTYHGLSLNVDMDLEPFQRIAPCGYKGLQMVDLAGLGVPQANIRKTGGLLVQELVCRLGYTHVHTAQPE